MWIKVGVCVFSEAQGNERTKNRKQVFDKRDISIVRLRPSSKSCLVLLTQVEIDLLFMRLDD
jgi:hypothetical protein